MVDLCVCSLYINTPVCILCPWHTCVYSLFLTHLFTCQICPTHLYVLQPGLRHLVFGHYFMPLVLGLQSVDKFNLFALRKSIRKNIPFQHKKKFAMQPIKMPQKLAIYKQKFIKICIFIINLWYEYLWVCIYMYST